MNQRESLLNLIIQFCQEKGSRTFTLQDLYDKFGDFRSIQIGGNTPHATVRRLLQELRDENILTFRDSRGAYSLRGIDLLQNEVESESIDLITNTSNPVKKEYLIESFARNQGWVRLAREMLGYLCLYPKCENTFIKPDGTSYIEVHHIIPLYQGGEDGLWNLSVVCAHHHRMAHFAEDQIRLSMEKILLRETQCRI